MKRWSARKLIALFLAVFVAVGMSLSVAQTTGMSMKMAMASVTTGSMHDGCPDCPDDDMKAMACSVVCTTPVLAVLPEGASVRVVGQIASFPTSNPLLRGTRAPPDLHPPRTTDIG
ncbi:hypothetical protein ACFYE9_25030 [Rhizobium leguminosarum]|uniref:Uncharacterized protein n=2 Tax=Rhizobium leguminosarum TaxID=384 RepID=A0A154IR17_RHILE|nr:hypothetical protein [Rhizobium leguminosarum]KZB02963.1 hypothetical protein A4A59_36105 [Rhizobium leguminosarum]